MGKPYEKLTFASTGVLGLSATLDKGILILGSGTLTFKVTGTPMQNGTANFEVFFQGKRCSFIVNVTPLEGTDTTTQVVEVTSTTGKIWMDRNLGATRAATSIRDTEAFGDLYQWGRKKDGHEKRNSTVKQGLVSAGNEGSQFITNPNNPYGWLTPDDNSRWQLGNNDPCPPGFRVPTETEFNNEIAAFPTGIDGAYKSPLKFVVGGIRNQRGHLINSNSKGVYWASTPNEVHHWSAKVMEIDYNELIDYGRVRVRTSGKVYGYSIRCIKE